MASLKADRRTEAVVRVANRQRTEKVERENARAVAEAPLLAWAGMVEQKELPTPETVVDRLELHRRVIAGTFMNGLKSAEREVQQMAAARWYAYLCSLHPDAPAGLDEYFAQRWRHGGPLMAKITARKTYAKLLMKLPVVEDFTVTPAPWMDIRRRHWLRVEVPPAARKAAEQADVEAWKAAHPEETAAWEAQRSAREARRAAGFVNPNELRFA